jgi:hypothetical protein
MACICSNARHLLDRGHPSRHHHAGRRCFNQAADQDGTRSLVFHVAKFDSYGFWSMAHEARANFTMLLGCLYLAAVGGGTCSFDSKLAAGRSSGPWRNQ